MRLRMLRRHRRWNYWRCFHVVNGPSFIAVYKCCKDDCCSLLFLCVALFIFSPIPLFSIFQKYCWPWRCICWPQHRCWQNESVCIVGRWNVLQLAVSAPLYDVWFLVWIFLFLLCADGKNKIFTSIWEFDHLIHHPFMKLSDSLHEPVWATKLQHNLSQAVSAHHAKCFREVKESHAEVLMFYTLLF